jgi:Surface antigen variable number repeat
MQSVPMFHMSIPWALVFLLVSSACAEESPPVVTSVEVPGTTLEVNLATQVGQPYDEKTIQKDVKYLWNLGRFEDVRVEEQRDGGDLALVFRVTPKPRIFLREVRLVPNTYGVELKVPDGTLIDAYRAHEIAIEAQNQLVARGYGEAKVTPEIILAGDHAANLTLRVSTGNALKVSEVRIEGDQAARRQLKALKPTRILPGVPGLWNGWRLMPSYSRDAVDSDSGRILSSYLLKGYLDAEVRPLDPEVEGHNARVSIIVNPGKKYPMPKNLCTSLLAQRREAQKQGILDFTVHFDFEHGATIDRGRPYHVGRIEFVGNHRYSDASLRSNFLLDEGDIFDEQRLRQSVARLSRTERFDPIDEKNVIVQPNPKTGYANVTVHVHERKRGKWNISGPVGPMSLAGPLEASISSRLPAWGRGIFELSTYTASIGIFAFGSPLIPILNAPPKFLPVVALARPFTPGDGWLSGFVIAPQLGWANSALSYVVSQMQGRLMPLLGGERNIQPVLPVTVTRDSGEAIMYCEPPGPRLKPLRAAAGIGLHLLGALPAY